MGFPTAPYRTGASMMQSIPTHPMALPMTLPDEIHWPGTSRTSANVSHRPDNSVRGDRKASHVDRYSTQLRIVSTDGQGLPAIQIASHRFNRETSTLRKTSAKVGSRDATRSETMDCVQHNRMPPTLSLHITPACRTTNRGRH